MKKWKKWFDASRYALAIGALIAALFISFGVAGAQTCAESFTPVAEGQESRPQTLCRDVSFTDPQIVMLVVAAAAMLLPDLSEFGVVGLINLKKKVAALEDEFQFVGIDRNYVEWPEGNTIAVLQGGLESVHKSARDRLHADFKDALTVGKLRSDIFFLDPRDAKHGSTGLLRIPKGLAIDVAEAESISFRPGEGAAGFSFEKQRGNVAWAKDHQTTRSGPARQWDKFYGLRDRLYNLSAPGDVQDAQDLRWIISVPLKVRSVTNESEITVGVVNVDYVEPDGVPPDAAIVRSPEQLDPLAEELERWCGKSIEPHLRTLPQVTVRVAVRAAGDGNG